MTTNSIDRMSRDRMTSQRSSLAFLLAATGFAALLACGNDDSKSDTATEDSTSAALEPAAPGGPTPNGLAVPAGVQDWGVVGAVARADDGTLRVIVGNETAVAAARSGQTNPWPEGSALSHLVWKAEKNPDDDATIGPGAFVGLTLMMKDSAKYAADGGWAYGAWDGPQLMPKTDPKFDRACVDCHTSMVKDKDFVFTDPGALPTTDALSSAADAPNGVAFPSKILDWRVIGVADITAPDPTMGTLRVIVGNPTAVTAARSGNTDPWPDGSLISHFVWAAGSNPATDATLGAGKAVSPGGFGAITLMQRSGALYEADGDWAYGVWRTDALTPPPAAVAPDPLFDRGCVDCHTSRASQRDMVFSRMAEFPPMMLPGANVAR
jgi:hypothetical protein